MVTGSLSASPLKNAVNGVTVVTLSGFAGAEASQGGSLNDGRYTLTALAGQITANGQQLLPVDSELLTDSFHHRATIVRFPTTTADGAPLVSGSSSALNLVVHDPTAHLEQTMEWKLPIVYPKDLQQEDVLSLPTLFALLAGLLAVLSPCLLQLTVYYTFALAGVSMQSRAIDPAAARSRILRTALCFIAGFTIVFTASGALAGSYNARTGK